ncbi:MAG: antitoxin [Pseudomonadota bacterium]
MGTALSPLVSEFETKELEASYTAWLLAKVQASIDDPRSNSEHDKVMAEARALLNATKKIHAAN